MPSACYAPKIFYLCTEKSTSEETTILFARTSAIALCTMCFVATLSQRVQSNLRICTDEQAPRCKLLDYRIKNSDKNGENRRFSTSIPFKYLYNKSGGTISMSPLVFYSFIPKCDSLFYFVKPNFIIQGVCRIQIPPQLLRHH